MALLVKRRSERNGVIVTATKNGNRKRNERSIKRGNIEGTTRVPVRVMTAVTRIRRTVERQHESESTNEKRKRARERVTRRRRRRRRLKTNDTVSATFLLTVPMKIRLE
jgi:hypothetical protein